MAESTATVEELRQQLEEKDTVLATLKSKTKLYIQKLQKESTEKLEAEQESVKQLQGKVEAARTYIAKQRDQNQSLTSKNEELTKELEALQAERSSAQDAFLAQSTAFEQNTTETEKLRIKLSESSTELTNFKEQVSSLNSQLEEQKREFAAAGAASDESSSRVSALEAELEQSNGESERLREQVSSLESQLEEQKREFAAAGAASDESSSRVSALEAELEQSNGESERLREQVSSLESQLEEQKCEYDVVMKEKIAVMTRLEKAKAFFHSQKADESSKQNDYMQVLDEKEAALLTIEDLRRTVEDLREEIVSMSLLRDTFSDEKANLSIELENSTSMLNEFIEKNDSLAKDKELLETECTTLKTELDSVIAAQGAHEEECTKLKNDAAVLSATMKTKSEELDGCQEKLTAANAKITSLQGQLKKYQVEVESLKSNLESEVLQNQDRKKKIRVYVDKLTADKASLHDQLESKKAAFNALTEDRNNICTQMLQTTDRLKLVQEEFQLERDELNCQLDESRDKISQLMIESAQEIETLQQRISVFEKQNSETLQQVEERVLQSNQEVSEHKSKRLAARSEMIGLAQAMEKAQQECSFLQDFIAHSLVPIALEQVSGLESAVRGIENATALVHKKQSMMIQKKASSLIPKSYSLDDTALDVSGHPISKPSLEDSHLSKSSSQKYMEKVKHLESEMERVRGGVKLLGRSVERLNEAIVFDSRWCGGIYDAMSYVMGSCFESSQRTVKNEYSSVQMQSLDDSGHDDGVDDSIHNLDSSSSTL